MSTSAQRVVAVFHLYEFGMTGEGDFFYPLLIFIRKMLDNARPVPSLPRAAEVAVLVVAVFPTAA
ncbi:hypothetical protein ACUY4S_000256 [Kosakonia sp. AX9b]